LDLIFYLKVAHQFSVFSAKVATCWARASLLHNVATTAVDLVKHGSSQPTVSLLVC